MLDRIRRKLFLSFKVIGSAEVSPSEDPSLGTAELLDILRRGSSALSTEGDEMTLSKFLKAPIDQILEVSRKMDMVKETKMRSELPANEINKVKTENDVGTGLDLQPLRDVEEEEMRLLNGIALVQSRLFEGKLVQRGSGNKDIARAWEDVQTRAKVDRLVMIDGINVVADHITPLVVSHLGCSSWRLIPTELSQVSEAIPMKKEKGKPKFEHEDWCNSCRDGGELVMCYRCPRGNISRHTALYKSLTCLGTVFHPGCFGISKACVARTPMMTCSQHKCHLCDRSTGDAGGMLFRYVSISTDVSEVVALIRAGVKHVPKRSAKTVCRKMISMLLGTPYLNCSLLPLLISNPWADLLQFVTWIRRDRNSLLYSLPQLSERLRERSLEMGSLAGGVCRDGREDEGYDSRFLSSVDL